MNDYITSKLTINGYCLIDGNPFGLMGNVVLHDAKDVEVELTLFYRVGRHYAEGYSGTCRHNGTMSIADAITAIVGTTDRSFNAPKVTSLLVTGTWATQVKTRADRSKEKHETRV